MRGIPVGPTVLQPGTSLLVSEEEARSLLPFVRLGRVRLLRQRHTGRWVAHYPLHGQPGPAHALLSGSEEEEPHAWTPEALQLLGIRELRAAAHRMGIQKVGRSKEEVVRAILEVGSR